MKLIIIAALALTAAVACNAPAEITARPDPTAATSGTLGSSKATDGTIPLKEPNRVPMPEDTTIKH